MTVWSYTGDPASSAKDSVRFHVGDVIKDDPQVNDEEIEYLLGDEGGNVLRAAARVAETIAAKYARQVDKTVGGLSLSAGRRQEKYSQLAQKLWSRARSTGSGLAAPYAGGISQSDKDTNAADTDRTQPAFTRTLHDFVAIEVDPNA
jgi:hypothetical protein